MKNAETMTSGNTVSGAKNEADPNAIAQKLTEKEQANQKRKKNLLKTNISGASFKEIDADLEKLAILNKLPQEQRNENWGKLVDYYNANIQDALDGIAEDANI